MRRQLLSKGSWCYASVDLDSDPGPTRHAISAGVLGPSDSNPRGGGEAGQRLLQLTVEYVPDDDPECSASEPGDAGYWILRLPAEALRALLPAIAVAVAAGPDTPRV